MTMPRTPEQAAADDALADAIRATIHAYDPDNTGLLVDYVVVAGQLNADDSHVVTVVDSGPGSPTWTQLGLLEVAGVQLRDGFSHDSPD
ncbi:hypothetical protein [Nocardia sp. CA-290969]|uniref:hypothetical protein n=1 Tax=Nocardia sp. CA-290969 TaxID=3239986 RepID=UPI003D93461B